MKKTPLSEIHESLGAKMVDFAGYYMPVSYTSIREEHLQVRKSVGVFDVSHMGEFIIRGNQSLEFVQHVTSNDASSLNTGDAQYSCFPNNNGGIIDDLIVYRLEDFGGDPQFMMVVNASNIDKDWEWLQTHDQFDVTLINISDDCGLLAIQGPKAKTVLQRLTDVNLDEIPFYHFATGAFAGIEETTISNTGYTGSGGFEIYVKNEHLPQLWNAIMEAGQQEEIMPIGLGARDTLRMEMGYCLYGNDIDDETNPLEAGLGWITKLKKGAFVSSDILTEIKSNGVTRRLRGMIIDGRRVPRKGYEIESADGEIIGVVTSGTLAPSLEKPIAMGYIDKAFCGFGNTVQIRIGKKLFPAEIIKFPFYKPSE